MIFFLEFFEDYCAHAWLLRGSPTVQNILDRKLGYIQTNSLLSKCLVAKEPCQIVSKGTSWSYVKDFWPVTPQTSLESFEICLTLLPKQEVGVKDAL